MTASNYDPTLVGGFSDTGPVRPANEDAFALPRTSRPLHLGALYVVADGVGGQQHGAEAAQTAVTVVPQVFYAARQENVVIQEALRRAVDAANQAIYDEAQARGARRMGCTLVAAVVHQGELYVAHVGDARAYLLQERKLRQLTRDDTWVQRQVDAGLLTREQAANHELRNVVTQVLGNEQKVDAHFAGPFPLRTDDRILLCSDGLYDALPAEQLYELVKSGAPAQTAEKLVMAAATGGATDNITAVVVQVGPVTGVMRAVSLPEQRAQAARRQQRPRWLPIAFLVIVAIVLMTVGVALLASSGRLATLFGGGGEATATPSMEERIPGLAPAVEPTETAVAEPSPTPLPTEMPTVAPLLTPSLMPEITPEAPEIATPQANLACINGFVFVWTDAQVDANRCGQFAGFGFELEADHEVEIVDSNARTVFGPGALSADGSCQQGSFIKVRSMTRPEIEGWVFNYAVRELEPGESCSP